MKTIYRLTNWNTVKIQIYRILGHPGVKHTRMWKKKKLSKFYKKAVDGILMDYDIRNKIWRIHRGENKTIMSRIVKCIENGINNIGESNRILQTFRKMIEINFNNNEENQNKDQQQTDGKTRRSKRNYRGIPSPHTGWESAVTFVAY